MASRAKKMLMMARKNVADNSKRRETNNSIIEDRDHHIKRTKPNVPEKATARDEKHLCAEILQNFDNGEAGTSKDSHIKTNEPNLQDNGQSSSDEFDDSDNDPHFIPTTLSESSSDSSCIDTTEISKLADIIESNITNNNNSPLSCISSTVASGNEHPISTLSATACQYQLGFPGVLTKTIVQPKWKRGTVKEKLCIPLKDCKKKCRDKITLDQQLILFNKYWELSSYDLRTAYLSGLIEITDRKRMVVQKSTTAPRNRIHSCIYTLMVNGLRVVDCQKCFKQTFDVTDSILKTVAQKQLSSVENSLSDQRGKRTPTNKLPEAKIQEIVQHINQFPAYESHYTRRRTSKRYLQSDLNILLMYKLYSSTYANPVSITKYAKVFRETGLKFKKPKTDTCSKCDNLKMQISLAKSDDEKKNLIEMQSHHHQAADFAFTTKENDKKLSKSRPNMKTYSFDLQQCLPTPLLRSNVSFYKRQLWTYNFTIHNCVTNEAFCYMWHEGIAKRGGNEIASCLFRHLMSESPGIEHIILYSDCCAGQNKNSYVATMFTTFLQYSRNIKIIDHKFLVPGHTHMECDVDHSIIERKKKKSNVQIHHPHEWYQFVRSAGSTRNFEVIEMEQNNMVDFTKVLKIKCMWRKTNNDGEQFKWADVNWLRFNKDFGKIQYKNTLKEDEPFKVLNIRRRGIPNIDMSHLPKCYDGPLVINPAKKKDLIDQFPLINEIYHNFYLNLNDGDVPNIDPDLIDENDSETEDMDIPNA